MSGLVVETGQSTDLPELRPPVWAEQLAGEAEVRRHSGAHAAVSVESRLSDSYSLITSHIHGARRMSADALNEAVYSSYMQIAEILRGAAAGYPVRFWNHIGHIHEPMGGEMDRYMVFNAGRYRAFCEWFGGDSDFDHTIATASGVGSRNDELIIHALAANRPGIAVANPRQIQPFRYSRRFGPQPPCFARATILPMPGDEAMVLIGGTASICGEESMYVGDLNRQLEETFENIRALLSHAGTLANRTADLGDVTDMRVYVVDSSTRQRIAEACRKAMPQATEIELLDSDICRRELLVEIEGRACLRRR